MHKSGSHLSKQEGLRRTTNLRQQHILDQKVLHCRRARLVGRAQALVVGRALRGEETKKRRRVVAVDILPRDILPVSATASASLEDNRANSTRSRVQRRRLRTSAPIDEYVAISNVDEASAGFRAER